MVALRRPLELALVAGVALAALGRVAAQEIDSSLKPHFPPDAKRSPAPVVFSDNFLTDTRSRYEIHRSVAWEKGALVFQRGGTLIWHAQAGPEEELTLGLHFPPLARAGDVVESEWMLFNRSGDAASVLWRRRMRDAHEVCEIDVIQASYDRKKEKLVRRLVRRFPQSEGHNPATWLVRFHHGVVRVECGGVLAAAGYVDFTPWQLDAVVGVQRSGVVRCTQLAFRGSPPMTAGQMQQLQKLVSVYLRAQKPLQAFHVHDVLAEQERVLPEVVAAFDEPHPVTVQLLTLLANGYAAIGEDRSIRFADRALALARQVYGPDHPTTGDLLVLSGQTRELVRDHSAAWALYQRALAIYQSILGKDSLKEGKLRLQMVALLETTEQFAAADEQYAIALRIHKTVYGPESLETAKVMVDMAARIADREPEPLSQRKDFYQKAIGYYRQALAIYDKLGRRLKEQLDKVVDPERAIDLVRSLHDQIQDIELRIADVDSDVANLYRHVKSYDLARDLQEKALAAREKTFGKNDVRVAPLLIQLGYLEHDQRHFAEARRRYDKAYHICEAVFGRTHAIMASLSEDIGATFRAEGNFAAARSHFERAFRQKLAIADQLLPGVSETEGLEYVVAVHEACHHLLSLLDSLPNVSPLAAYTPLWQTRELVGRAIAGRRHPSLHDEQSQAVWKDLRTVRQALAELALADLPTGGPEVHQRKLAELTQRKEELERELARRSEPFRQQQLLKQITPTDLAACLPADVALVDIAQVNTWKVDSLGSAQIQSARYQAFVLRKADGPPGYRLSSVPLGPADAIDEQVRAWRQSLTREALARSPLDSARSVPTASTSSPERQLRQLIWEKLEPHLSGCTTVLIVPDGALARVPWGALPGKKEGSYLLEDCAVATVSTGQEVYDLLTAKRVAPASRLVLVGGVDYDQAEILSAGQGPSASPLAPGERPSWARLPGTVTEVRHLEQLWGKATGIVRLEGTAATEAAIRTWAPQSHYLHLATHGFFTGPRFRSLFDKEPAKAADGSASRFKGKRSTVRGRNPLLASGVVLAGANRPRPADKSGLPLGDDGILTAEEVTDLDLRQVELVVLSACETGLGDVAAGEGVFGLQRAFTSAGARSVVASLWKVDDQATAALMKRLYSNLWTRHMGKLESLREAQLWLLRQGVRDAGIGGRGPLIPENPRPARDARLSPSYWAAFVLSGDWR